MNRFIRCVSLMAFMGLLAVTSLQAADTTWTGAAGDNDFTNPVNWDNGLPADTFDNTWIHAGGQATLSTAYATRIGEFRNDGLLRITGGSLTCGWLDTAMELGTNGAIYHTGGTLTTDGGSWSSLGVGGGYGYYYLSGETSVSNQGYLWIGGGGEPKGGSGVFDQIGGTTKFSQNGEGGFTIGGNGAVGAFNISGGTVIQTGWDNTVGRYTNGYGVLNISGTGTTVSMVGMNVGLDNASAVGIVNLGGGSTLTARYIRKGDGTGIFNFHGGTLKLAASGAENIMTTTNYVYSEGAVINTDGFNVTVTSPLLSPATGNGVTGFSTFIGGNGYIGAPAVKIEGDGTGATARAVFDPITGTVTGIVVTNPGTGYSYAMATLVGGGGTGASAADATFGANLSGGLTKTGLGTLTLSRDCTYTGATIVEQGTLVLKGRTPEQAGIDNMASSAIVVKAAGTLAGTTPVPTFAYYPATTVEAGGTIAAGTPYFEPNFHLNALTLENNANLKFTFDTSGNVDAIDVIGNVAAAGGAPVTVKVGFSGVATSPTTVLRVGGNLDNNVTFSLPNPVLDSFDAINTSGAWLTTVYGAGGSVKLNPTGLIADPAWSNGGGGKWSTVANWGSAGPVPNGGDKRAMFTAGLSGSVAINLDTSPQLSSMIFNSLYGESYTITAADSSKMITLKSSTAENWHVSVLAGTHTVAADMKLAAGTGQSIIRLVDGSQLTLSGVLSDETPGDGVNFAGNFNGGTGTGVLTLSGANTYSGPTVVNNGRLEAAALANGGAASSIGTSSADPANLVLNNAALKYAGPAVVTDRGFSFGSAVTLETVNDLTLGDTAGTGDATITKKGEGALRVGAITRNSLILDVQEGAMSLTNATFNNFRLNGVLKVQDGDTITGNNNGQFYIGNGGKDAAIIQTGGTVDVNSLDWLGGFMGLYSPAYYGLSGGNLRMDHFVIGEQFAGVVDQTGGTLEARMGFNLGGYWGPAGPGGVYTLSGGAVNVVGWSLNLGGVATGTLNVQGAGVLTSAVDIYMSTTGGDKGIINLGAVDGGTTDNGVIIAPYLGEYNGGTGTVNFHGGKLKSPAAGNSTWLAGTTNYVYGEGAVFEVGESQTATVPGVLSAPEGQGVQSIVLSNGGAGYTGAPLVKISGGGTGATAIAKVVSGVVTEIVITNPGVNYTSVPTIELFGGGATTSATATDAIVQLNGGNVSGGLTKLGLGTLNLTGVLSYTDDTFVNEGTLTVVNLNTPAATVSVATGATLSATSIVADSLNIGVAPLPAAAAAVPEPGTLVLLVLAGLGGAVAYVRRK